VAPAVTGATALVFELVVTDTGGHTSAPSTVTAMVEPPIVDTNRPPLAVAADQSVGRLANVTLDASGSSDPDGDRLFFLWVQVAGPPVTLTGSNLAQARFLAPNADATLAFDLAVNDGQVTTHRAVTVTVTAADAGGCGCTTAGDATPVGLLGLFLAAGALRRRRRVAEA
jgi:MYXO-CTERM domain-containing protein